MLIAVIDHSLHVCEVIDWDREATARAAIERARRADPDGTPDDWEDAARDDPLARLERPDANRMVDITGHDAIRVGWRFERGLFYPPAAEEQDDGAGMASFGDDPVDRRGLPRE